MEFSWLLVIALAVALIGGGLVVWVKRRQGMTWIAALQEGAEFAIARLAMQGMPKQANEIGHSMAEALDKAGPKIKALNNAMHALTKERVAEALPEKKNTRTLIADAFRAEGRSETPTA